MYSVHSAPPSRCTRVRCRYQFGDISKKLAKGFLGKLSEAAGEAKKKLEDEEKK